MIDAVLGLNKPQTQETALNNVPNNTNQPIISANQVRNDYIWALFDKMYFNSNV